MKNAADLITLFNRTFEESEQTVLLGGAQEPLYLPADPNVPHSKHRIIFRADYFASALHEVAHWCLAGKERRQQEDYGYWYQPDGRSPNWQAQFEIVEVKPQALECIFSAAADFLFQVSADNLMNPAARNDVFQEKVAQQVALFLQNGLPDRARLFQQALLEFYKT